MYRLGAPDMTETPVEPAPPSAEGGAPGLRVTVGTRGAARSDHAYPMTVQVVGVAGDVDLTTGALLAHGLTHAKDQTPPGPDPTRRVVVDVTAMTFCGAAGLGLLARAADHSRRTGTVWALAGLTPRLTRLLATLWPTARPALYRDRATAITAVGLGDPWPIPAA